jgi:hypothetical protein
VTSKSRVKRVRAPKVLYSNMVNMAGLYSRTPVKCFLRRGGPDSVYGASYWDSTGDYDTYKPGLEIRTGWIKFTSESKREVEAWTEGASAVMRMLRAWSGAYDKDITK